MAKIPGGGLSSGTGGSAAPAANNRPPQYMAGKPACPPRFFGGRSRHSDSPSAKPGSERLRELPSDSPPPGFFLHLILDGAHSGVFNMQMDEALLRRAIRTKDINATLRFYRFSEPCWTVGYGAWKSASSAVRRLTGGGIVKHGDDLTYSLVLPYSREGPLGRVRKSYFIIHETLCRTLRRLGVNAERHTSVCGSGAFCFDAPVTDDVMLNGQKAAGGAQKRSQGHLLHQGSIAWPLLLRIKPDLDETGFMKEFADELGRSLGISVKESSLQTDNVIDAGHMACHLR